MLKRLITISTILIVSLALIIHFMLGYPLIFYKSTVSPLVDKINQNIGDTLMPLDNYSLNADYSVYLVFDKHDIDELPDMIIKGKVLKLNDQQLFKEFKKSFSFIYTGGDMATCESELLIFKDNVLIFKSWILINEFKVGIQTIEYGWCEVVDKIQFLEVLSKFHKVYSPVLLL